VHSNTIAGKKTGLRKGRHGFKSDSSDGTSDFSASSKSTELLRGQGYRLPPSSSSSSFADTWDGESAPLPHRTPAEIAAAMEGSAPVRTIVPSSYVLIVVMVLFVHLSESCSSNHL